MPDSWNKDAKKARYQREDATLRKGGLAFEGLWRRLRPILNHLPTEGAACEATK
jgi:hypothetical protein